MNKLYKSYGWVTVQAKTLETKILNLKQCSPSFSAIERLLLKNCVIVIESDNGIFVLDEEKYRQNKKAITQKYLQ